MSLGTPRLKLWTETVMSKSVERKGRLLKVWHRETVSCSLDQVVESQITMLVFVMDSVKSLHFKLNQTLKSLRISVYWNGRKCNNVCWLPDHWSFYYISSISKLEYSVEVSLSPSHFVSINPSLILFIHWLFLSLKVKSHEIKSKVPSYLFFLQIVEWHLRDIRCLINFWLVNEWTKTHSIVL